MFCNCMWLLCKKTEKECHGQTSEQSPAALCEEPVPFYSTHALGFEVKLTAVKKRKEKKKVRVSVSLCGMETALDSDATALASLSNSAERKERGDATRHHV